MKKRWGKPITQVQRFVPQYCVQICGYYDLAPVTGMSNKSIDFHNINIKDSDESAWSSAGRRKAPASSVRILNCSEYNCYEQIDWPGGTDYTDTSKYKHVTLFGTYYLYSGKLYNLGRDKYYDNNIKNQS